MNHLFVLLQFFRNATLLDESQLLTIKEKFIAFVREKPKIYFTVRVVIDALVYVHTVCRS